MSYILAALNKAERERQTASTVGVAVQQPPAEVSKRPWWPVLLISMLGSGLVLALYLAWQGMAAGPVVRAHLSPQSSVSQVPPAATHPSDRVVMERDAMKTAAAVQTHSVDVDANTAAIATLSLATPAGSESVPTLRALAVSSRPQRPSPNESAMTHGQEQATWKSETQPSGYIDDQDGSRSPSGDTGAMGGFGAGSRGMEELTPTQLEKIPVLHSLPEHVRAQLPHLELNVHVYSDSPTKRFVYINSERCAEGSQLEGGVVLEKIIPNGVVMRQGSVRFRLLLET